MEMELQSVPKFHSKDEEVQYWMSLAHELYQKQEEAKRELEEYQESSIILERELETSYEQSVGKNRDLQLSNNKLAQENEESKARLNEQVAACTQLQCKVQKMTSVIDEMTGHIRKLEQENDDLERANRELKGSEEAVEDQLNNVIEKLALLETEIEEKEGLQIIIQRLKDENKDLKQQIEVDLRKTHGSPLTRIRKMSMVRRGQLRRNSAESEKSLSIHEETPDVSYKTDSSNLLEYISELEREISCLKKNQRTSKIVVVDVASELKTTISTDFFCDLKMSEKEGGSIPDYLLQSIENKDQSQEAQVRLRSSGSVSVERAPRPLSTQSKTQQDENARAVAAGRATRLLENRVKKVKDEEKRQNLMHFLKRFRYRQPSWMRKKH